MASYTVEQNRAACYTAFNVNRSIGIIAGQNIGAGKIDRAKRNEIISNNYPDL